mmetsp:Transcript_17931/g.31368  ORF Transcript_17931/g.31368 Transcript_17931/m.31368 type:complete len:668 (-) Transcript_17931:38-2041(-)
MSEKPIFTASCAVYYSENNAWKEAGASLSNATLWFNPTTSTYHVVAVDTASTQRVIVDAALWPGVAYQKENDTFHHMTDQSGRVYGLSFASQEQGDLFAKAVAEAVDQLKQIAHTPSNAAQHSHGKAQHSSSDILLRSIVWKKGNWVWKKFNQRQLILHYKRQPELEYRDMSGESLGVLVLEAGDKVSRVVDNGRRVQFNLLTNNPKNNQPRTYEFKTDTEELCEKWFKAIQRAIAGNSGTKSAYDPLASVTHPFDDTAEHWEDESAALAAANIAADHLKAPLADLLFVKDEDDEVDVQATTTRYFKIAKLMITKAAGSENYEELKSGCAKLFELAQPLAPLTANVLKAAPFVGAAVNVIQCVVQLAQQAKANKEFCKQITRLFGHLRTSVTAVDSMLKSLVKSQLHGAVATAAKGLTVLIAEIRALGQLVSNTVRECTEPKKFAQRVGRWLKSNSMQKRLQQVMDWYRDINSALQTSIAAFNAAMSANTNRDVQELLQSLKKLPAPPQVDVVAAIQRDLKNMQADIERALGNNHQEYQRLLKQCRHDTRSDLESAIEKSLTRVPPEWQAFVGAHEDRMQELQQCIVDTLERVQAQPAAVPPAAPAPEPIVHREEVFWSRASVNPIYHDISTDNKGCRKTLQGKYAVKGSLAQAKQKEYKPCKHCYK